MAKEATVFTKYFLSSSIMTAGFMYLFICLFVFLFIAYAPYNDVPTKSNYTAQNTTVVRGLS